MWQPIETLPDDTEALVSDTPWVATATRAKRIEDKWYAWFGKEGWIPIAGPFKHWTPLPPA